MGCVCGRYTLNKRKKDLEDHFDAEVQEVLPRFNIAPTQEALVLANDTPHRMTQMRWGFAFTWQGNAEQLLINAKSETILEKRTFRSSFEERRCLVIADSFFEWRRTGRETQPVRFMLASDEPFAFAGIWMHSDGVRRFVILTTEPNDLVRPVHTRMPAMLMREDYVEWLSPDTPVERLSSMLRPHPVNRMKAYDVDRVVGSAKVDSPQCIEPYRPIQGALF